MSDLADVVHIGKIGGVGGSEKHLLDLLPLLPEHGFRPRMVVLHEGEEGAFEFARELAARGVPVETVRMRLPAGPVVLGRLARRLRELRPRVAHTHLVHADVLGLSAAALARVPVRVTTKHGFDPFRHSRAFALLDRSVARLAHRRIAISAGLADYLAAVEGFRREDFEVVHYGVPAGPEPARAGEPGRIACVGRFIPIKAHATLLEAFARVRAARPDATLDLAGSGPLEGELRAQAAALGLGGSVRFLGRVRPADPVFEAASVVAVPSLGEGFGQVAAEAQARARPVVASRAGGLAEIVADGETGLLVPPGQPGPLADALLELLGDPERARALGAAGRRRIQLEFSPERCAAETAAVYRAALAG